VGGGDGNVRLYKLETGEELLRLTGHSQAVTGIVAVGTHLLATASDDNTVRLWERSSALQIDQLTSDVGFVALRPGALDHQVIAHDFDANFHVFAIEGAADDSRSDSPHQKPNSAWAWFSKKLSSRTT
jgi:WD40 repeat protein